MTALTPTEHDRGLRLQRRSATIELLLSDRDGSAGRIAGSRVAGATLRLSPVHPAAMIAPEALAGAAAAVIEVSADDPQSIARFQRLAAEARIPLVAAVYEAPLALVRNLLRVGAQDVLPMPVDLAELEATLAPLLRKADEDSAAGTAATGKLVSVIKSGGGVGATALLTQLAVLHAQRQAGTGSETCLIDLDVQFGDAAFQLGLRPPLSLANLLEAGSRLDASLLQAAAVTHASGLKLIASPGDMMPLDAFPCEQLLDVIEVARRQFGTLFLDLPANWTDWSLSLVARSDLILLVSELSVPALRQIRRQLDLLDAQGLGDLDLRIVLNRHEDRMFGRIKAGDVRQALGRDVSYTISNDPALMRDAIDQGQPITEIRRRSALAKDLGKLADDVAVLARRES